MTLNDKVACSLKCDPRGTVTNCVRKGSIIFRAPVDNERSFISLLEKSSDGVTHNYLTYFHMLENKKNGTSLQPKEVKSVLSHVFE